MSGVVVAAGALLAAAAVKVSERRVGATAVRLGAALSAVLLPGLLPLSADAESGVLRVGAVQGNVPVQGAEATSQAREVAANHARGTRALLEQVDRGDLDLVLWPESASDVDPRTDADVAAIVDDAASAVDAPILLGTQRLLPGLRYNDYVLWEPGAGADRGVVYTKQRPVPFGEYVPHRQLFRRLAPVVDRITRDMVAGTGQALLEVDIRRLGRPVPITTAICFEVAYDDLIREGVRGGGELIVVPTNNASFGRTQESAQQLAMSRFRAAEHGRAVVQISTVGVSAVVAPSGSLLATTGLFTADQMIAELPLRTSITTADRLGEWPGALVGGLGTLLGRVSQSIPTRATAHAGE